MMKRPVKPVRIEKDIIYDIEDDQTVEDLYKMYPKGLLVDEGCSYDGPMWVIADPYRESDEDFQKRMQKYAEDLKAYAKWRLEHKEEFDRLAAEKKKKSKAKLEQQEKYWSNKLESIQSELDKIQKRKQELGC